MPAESGTPLIIKAKSQSGPVQRVLSRLKNVRSSGDGWVALCASHDDQVNSLSIGEGEDGRALLHCFAGCETEKIVAAIGLEMKDLSPNTEKSRRGLTLAQYAKAKNLPEDFLRNLGLDNISHLSQPAVRIPYLDETGKEIATRYRLGLEGANQFRWKKGSRLAPYGLWRLDDARRAGYLVLVEGESDTQTLWFHDIPALGIPGADTWQEPWAGYLNGITIIYAVIERDKGGETVLKWLGNSSFRDRVRLVSLDEAKDPSELYLRDPHIFRLLWDVACADARPWTEQAKAEAEARRQELWGKCAELARKPYILDHFSEDLSASGITGERRVGQLLYLISNTRHLDDLVSAVIKGLSSAGKSIITKTVTSFFPADAYHELTAMSERALAYTEEPLSHRFLVLYEAAALRGDFMNYLLRSLLSEKRLRYWTVDKPGGKLKGRMIEKEGPTGLLLTTTQVNLPPEEETRLFSIPVTDTPEQTKAVLRQLARQENVPPVDLTRWHALQEWLEGSEHRVMIGYAETLAELIPPVAVRLRRDFKAILALIKSHAILHQATRPRDAEGRIIANFDDYTAVRDLVSDLLTEGVEITVSNTIRETVRTVARLSTEQRGKAVSITALARALGTEKPAALRRARMAISRGYLENLEDRRGRPAALVPGDSLPEDVELLPTETTLEEADVAPLEKKYYSTLKPKRET